MNEQQTNERLETNAPPMGEIDSRASSLQRDGIGGVPSRQKAMIGLTLVITSLFVSFPLQVSGIGYTVVKLCDLSLLVIVPLMLPLCVRKGGFEFIPDGVRNGIGLLTLTFAGWFVLGLIYRDGAYDSVDLRKFISVYLALAFMLLGLKFGAMGLLREAVRIYIVVAAIVAGYSLLRHYLSFLQIDNAPWYPRISGFFEGPNTLGYVLAIAVCLACCYHPRRVADTFEMAIIMLGVVLAASRAVFVGVALAIPYLVISRATNLRRLMFSVFLAGGIYVALYPGTGWLINDGGVLCEREATVTGIVGYEGCALPLIFQRELATDNARITILSAELDVIFNYPILGAGLGSFAHLTGGKLDHHNTALWLLCEFGVIGSALVLASLFAIFFNGWKRPDLKSVESKVLVGLILLAAGSSVGMTLFYERFFWFLVGLLVASIQASPDRTGAN